MCLFLGAQRARFPTRGIEQPRLLLDCGAVLNEGDLPARLGLDRLADEANGVDVLDLAARAESFSGPPHRDINVGAQIALLHVAVAGADVAQEGAALDR